MSGLIRLENRGHTPYHFPVVEVSDTRLGTAIKERYRVIIGNSDDAQIDGEDEDGQIRKVENSVVVPQDAWEEGWEMQEIHRFLPPPEVTMTVDQYCDEVFPEGSLNHKTLERLLGEGTIRREEKPPGCISRYIRRRAKEEAEAETSEEA